MGGRVLAVSGTFQRRSHPVNPLSLDPTVPPRPPPPSLPQVPLIASRSLSPIAHRRPPFLPALPLSPGQAQMGYRYVKGRHCENGIKGRVPPTCTPTLPAPRPRGFNPPKYSRMKANIVMSRSTGLVSERKTT